MGWGVTIDEYSETRENTLWKRQLRKTTAKVRGRDQTKDQEAKQSVRGRQNLLERWEMYTGGDQQKKVTRMREDLGQRRKHRERRFGECYILRVKQTNKDTPEKSRGMFEEAK